MKRGRQSKCCCITVWQVDRGDEWITIGPFRAAELLIAGFTIRLTAISSNPLVPVCPVGVVYEGAKEYIAEACVVCGWPTLIIPV